MSDVTVSSCNISAINVEVNQASVRGFMGDEFP